jgi:hypothetical protein
MKSLYEFHPVPGLPDITITRLGRVRYRGNPRATSLSKNRLVLTAGGTTYSVARLVGRTFCPDYSEDRVAAYLDGNPENVRPSNLRWLTRNAASLGYHKRKP